MEQMKNQIKTETDKDMEEFMRAHKDVLYKRTSDTFGSRVNEASADTKKASDGKFTKHLAASGMYKYNGLNTVVDKEKVVNGSKDWMLKLV